MPPDPPRKGRALHVHCPPPTFGLWKPPLLDPGYAPDQGGLYKCDLTTVSPYSEKHHTIDTKSLQKFCDSSFSKVCRPRVPCIPRSRAISHNRHQDIVSATVATSLAEGWLEAYESNASKSDFIISVFIDFTKAGGGGGHPEDSSST